MKDLTRDPQTGAKAHLVNSSMSGSNTVYANPELAMTAPGSPGVIPPVEVVDNLPLPQPSNGSGEPNPWPVNYPNDPGASGPAPAGRENVWTEAHGSAGSRWNEV